MTYLLDEFAPFKKVTRKEYRLMTKPWISKEILEKCKERDTLLKSISKETDQNKIIELRNRYKQLSYEITLDKRTLKKAYYSAYFENNKLKSAEIWKGIRSLVNIKSSKSFTIKLLDSKENLISNPKLISQIFNSYFSSIGPTIEQKNYRVPGSF